VFQAGLDPSKLVFIDETWAKTNMTRPRGRSFCGARLVASVPYGHWKTTTFLAGLRTCGLTARLVVDGAINGEIFLGYVRQHLVPTLAAGDVVIMDNLSSHKRVGVREAIEAAGATLLFLPPYSPDLNPIETRSPSSNGCSRARRNAPSMHCGTPADDSSIDSPNTSAATTFATAATAMLKSDAL
jgi:hypothetical protein